jgi:hypothetical protein
MTRVVSHAVAAWMAWGLAAIVVALCLVMTIGEMRGSHTRAANA